MSRCIMTGMGMWGRGSEIWREGGLDPDHSPGFAWAGSGGGSSGRAYVCVFFFDFFLRLQMMKSG